MSATSRSIAVACPIRSVCDHHAKVFAELGRLQGHYLGTRRGAEGIPEALSRRFPLVGLLSYAVARTLPRYGETAKVACFPLFDAWVKRQIPAGTPVFSSYGYVVETFRQARATGGYTLLDGGNSLDGRLEFWAPPGTYRLVVGHAGRHNERIVEIVLGEPTEQVIDLATP